MRSSLQLDELAFPLQFQESLLHGQHSCLGPAVLSLIEFKSCSCCQTTFVGAIHYFALPFRILHFSREFTTVICQVVSNSVFLIFLCARHGPGAAGRSGSFV